MAIVYIATSMLNSFTIVYDVVDVFLETDLSCSKDLDILSVSQSGGWPSLRDRTSPPSSASGTTHNRTVFVISTHWPLRLHDLIISFD